MTDMDLLMGLSCVAEICVSEEWFSAESAQVCFNASIEVFGGLDCETVMS